jgi:hypothetical protein
MNINFNGVQEQSTKPKMKPGIYEVEITGIVEGKANNGTPTIEMGFVTTNGQYEHTEKFAANPIVSAGKEKSALDITLTKLKHIATKVVTVDELAAVNSVDDYNKLLTGKQLRVKFIGEERFYNNNTYVNARIGFAPFAEPLETQPTQLTYNPNDSYDYKKAVVSPAGTGLPSTGPVVFKTPVKSDLPF